MPMSSCQLTNAASPETSKALTRYRNEWLGPCSPLLAKLAHCGLSRVPGQSLQAPKPVDLLGFRNSHSRRRTTDKGLLSSHPQEYTNLSSQRYKNHHPEQELRVSKKHTKGSRFLPPCTPHPKCWAGCPAGTSHHQGNYQGPAWVGS